MALESWQKFPLTDGQIARNLRSMLRLSEQEDIPEALWVVMGIHHALERQFISHPWSHRDLAAMIVEAQAILPSLGKACEFVRGATIQLTHLGREGKYWNPAPLGLHLVNCDGDVFLVKAEDIDAPEAAIFGSKLNVDARRGIKKSNGELVGAR